MFRRIADRLPGKAEALFKLHPSELSALLEMTWTFRKHTGASDLGQPDRRSDLPELPGYLLNLFPETARNRVRHTTNANGDAVVATGEGFARFDHLIYAFCIENSRVYEIFAKVLVELLHGEKFGVPTADAQHWLRNTEELFFRNPPQFSICSVASDIRPDLRASRRNAYYRMFGMDLSHGQGELAQYPYIRPEAANSEFVSTLQQFLYEVWVGIKNFSNSTGAKPTDDAAIANQARKLHDMLMTRRQNGNLAREEFCFVSMMHWFHLTLEFNSPIVKALRAEASSEEQRLFKIAERVGVPALARSEDFFQMADPLSRLLTLIETGDLNDPIAVPALYQPNQQLSADMRTIITHWSLATGQDLKTVKPGVTA